MVRTPAHHTGDQGFDSSTGRHLGSMLTWAVRSNKKNLDRHGAKLPLKRMKHNFLLCYKYQVGKAGCKFSPSICENSVCSKE